MSYRNDANCPMGCKVYIGGLERTASKEEIECAFERYGKLVNVFVARNPPGFAFVEFADPQDAEDSVRALDGRSICGSRVKVEISHGRSKNTDRGFRGGDDRRGGDRGGMDRRGGGDRRDDRGMDRRIGGGDRDRSPIHRRMRSRTPEKKRYSDDRLVTTFETKDLKFINFI